MSKFYEKIIFLIVLILFFPLYLYSDPPDPITDLKAISHFKSIELQWTVPNSIESIVYYEIRISTYSQITETNWDDFEYKIEISTSQQNKGDTKLYLITGLNNSKLYYFAIKSSTSTDKQPLSNVSNSPAGVPSNTQPFQFSLSTPTYGVIISSSIVEFDWNDADDQDISYGDSLVYILALSTFPTNLFSSSPSFTGAIVKDNITTSYYMLNAKNELQDNTTYYWRVKVVDSEGLANWSFLNIDQSKFIINHTPEPPSNFSLKKPVLKSTIATTSDVDFDWEDPTDPDPQDFIKYSIFISSYQDFSFHYSSSNLIYSSYTLKSSDFDWTENTTYWWYVVAEDSFGLKTYSATWWFIVNDTNEPPQSNFLLSPGTTIYYEPIPIIYTLNPTFYWTKSSDPDPYSSIKYELLISSYSDEPKFENSIFYPNREITPSTYYYLPSSVLQDDTTYFWRIRILDEPDSGYEIYSSTTYWFYTCVFLNSASLKSPLNEETTSYLEPKFEWEPNISGYKLNFSSQTLIYWTDSDTTTILNLAPSTTFYISPQPLKNNSTYFWQIITHSNSDDIPLISTSSAIFKFYTKNLPPANFELTTPSGTIITSDSATLQWETSSDEDEVTYTVFYSTNNFLTISSSNTASTSLTIDNLQDNATYFWYVLAKDFWGQETFSNTTFYFVVNHIPEPPTNFALYKPSNNKILTNTYTTFYWDASSDPDPFESVIYELRISTDKEFNFIVFSTRTQDTNFFLPRGYLEINNTYYWVVIASSTGSGYTFSNSTFSFRIFNTPPVGLNLVSPSNFEILESSDNVIIIWNPAYDPQDDEFWYELYYTTSVGLNNVWLSTNVLVLPSTQNYYKIDTPVDDTTYYWYILAVDTYNNKTSTGIFVFYTSFENQPPTKPTILDPKENEINLPYIIKWTTSTDSDLFDEVKYTIKISTDEKFSVYKIIVSSVSNTYYELYNFELSPNTYYLKIEAFDKKYAINFSTTSFVVKRYYLQISSPTDNYLVEKLPIEISFSSITPLKPNDNINYKIIISSSQNFDFKTEKILSSNSYKITDPPIYPSIYYWYIEAYYNNEYVGGSSTSTFVVPYERPPSVAGIVLSTSTNGVYLSWNKVDIPNLWGYKIYSGVSLNSLVEVYFTTSTEYFDFNSLDKQLFYSVVVVNQFGLESVSNPIVRVYLNEKADLYISEDGNLVISVPSSEQLQNVNIKRLTDEESEVYIYVFKIEANKTKLKSFAEITISKPQSEKNYIVQYYDGHNWINFQSKDFEDKIIVKTQYLGKYRILETTEKLEDLVIIGCSPKKRIITPNNDGVNDYIEFQYKVGSFIEGKIFDLYGRKITLLKRKDTNILYFDGKDESGNLLPPGVYIYNINSKSDNKNFSGTIVIKY